MGNNDPVAPSRGYYSKVSAMPMAGVAALRRISSLRLQRLALREPKYDTRTCRNLTSGIRQGALLLDSLPARSHAATSYIATTILDFMGLGEKKYGFCC